MDESLKLYRLVPIAAVNPFEVDNDRTHHERGVVSGTIGGDTIISTQI